MIPTGRATSDEATGLVAVLIRREDVLRSLLERSQDKPGLVASLGSSRSTVDRAIDELKRCGLVERVDNQYRVSYFGRAVVVAFDRLVTDLSQLSELRSLLAEIPADAGFDSSVFEGATVEHVPAFGPDVVEATFGDATRVRVAAPLVATLYGTANRGDRFLDGVSAEFLLNREVLAHVERFYPAELAALEGMPGVSVYEVEEHLPFCLIRASDDDRDWVTLLFRADDDTVAVLRNDAPAAVEWAEAAYERCRKTSTPYAPV